MPEKKQSSNLLERKIGVLLELRNFIYKQYRRDRFGHKLHPLIESNTYLYEIYHSKHWIDNFETLELLMNKFDIRHNILHIEIVIKEALTNSEVNFCKKMFSELLSKLRIVDDNFFETSSELNFSEILELSAAAISHELTFMNQLKLKYGLLKKL